MSILSLLSPFAWIRRIISLLLLCLIGFYVYSGYLVYESSRLPTNVYLLKPAKALLLLGPVGNTKELSGDMIGRLNQTINLYKAKIAPRVIIAGSGSGLLFAERYLTENQIPKQKVTFLRTASIPDALSKLAASYSDKPYMLTVVADALQTAYIDNLAADDGIRIELSPAVGSESVSITGLTQLAKEASAVAVGKIIGFTNVDWG